MFGCWLLLVASLTIASAQSNILINGDFEQPDGSYGHYNWWCANCNGANVSSDVVSGTYSYKITNRGAQWAGLRQRLGALSNNKRYFISGWLKLLTTDDDFENSLRIQTASTVQRPDESTTKKYQKLTELKDVKLADGWINLAAEFIPGDYSSIGQVQFVEIYVEARSGDSFLADYLADKFELYELSENPTWRDQATLGVEQHRYNNLSINIKTRSSSYTGAKLTITQLSSEFGLGSSVDAFELQHNENYRNTFLNHFEWGELEADMSWRRTEYSKNKLTWEDADMGINILEAHGKRVRGGSVHEADKDLSPEFVRMSQNPDDVFRYSMKRVDDLVGRYRYRCEHWEVLNGMLSEDTNHLANIYGSSDINRQLFRRSREVDYAAKLFINEAGLLTSDENIQKVLLEIQRMKQLGIPVDGIGAHGSFEEFPGGNLIRHRLNRLASAELPIWITRYSYSDSDVSRRADALEDFMLAVLSNPHVKGVMLRDFWDGHNQAENASFFDGPDLQVNTAGQSLQSIVSELTEYEHEKTFDIASNQELPLAPLRLRHGVYQVSVTKPPTNQVKIQYVQLFKHQGDKMITITI